MTLSKYFVENFMKSILPAAQKYFVWNFLRFSEKIGGFKIFIFLLENVSELRFILIGLSPGGAIQFNKFLIQPTLHYGIIIYF